MYGIDVTTLSPEMLEQYRICNDETRKLRVPLEALGPNPAYEAEVALAKKLAAAIAFLEAEA
jgi:hypothetical protein